MNGEHKAVFNDTEPDADYVLWITKDGENEIEHARLMVPGSQLEGDSNA
jgi:hypothetical protein